MKKQLGFTSVEVCMVLISLAGLAGWIWNIVKIIGSGLDVWNGLLIARVIGVFVAPLGAVLGFL